MDKCKCPYAEYLYGNQQGDIICTANSALNVCCLQRKRDKCYVIPDSTKCERRKRADEWTNSATDNNCQRLVTMTGKAGDNLADAIMSAVINTQQELENQVWQEQQPLSDRLSPLARWKSKLP